MASVLGQVLDLASQQIYRQAGELMTAVSWHMTASICTNTCIESLGVKLASNVSAGQNFVPGPACFSGRQHQITSPQQARNGGPAQPVQSWSTFKHRQRGVRLLALPVLNSSAVTDGAAPGGVEDKWIARVLAAYHLAHDSSSLPYP